MLFIFVKNGRKNLRRLLFLETLAKFTSIFNQIFYNLVSILNFMLNLRKSFAIYSFFLLIFLICLILNLIANKFLIIFLVIKSNFASLN